MYSLSVSQVSSLLEDNGLLREIIVPAAGTDMGSGTDRAIETDTICNASTWVRDARYLPDDTPPSGAQEFTFTAVSYDSRMVGPQTLFFCKGRFMPEYFASANASGLRYYVAESDFSENTPATGFIVSDIRKAMAVLSASFFGYPQHKLTVIGITGTKGKTTTAYFTHAMVNEWSQGKAALLSSVDNCTDGKTFIESDLTTPESLDLFGLMGQAVENGMRYLVMEVSSQAYKLERVFGLTFDMGVFLNIAPDHISPIEHPSFEDYLFCKRQLIAHSRRLVLGADSDHHDLLIQDAAVAQVPVSEFKLLPAATEENATNTIFARNIGDQFYEFSKNSSALGACTLAIEGDFNGANAAAAVAIIDALGIEIDPMLLKAIEPLTIPGRMEKFDDGNGIIAYVDYAHNFSSVTALLDFVEQRYGGLTPWVTLVTGSAGNKALDRRAEIVEAAQERVDEFIFTQEDTDTESFEDIAQQMFDNVSNTHVRKRIIIDRTSAVETALAEAHTRANDGIAECNIVLVIAKGEERWIKNHGDHIAYEGDDAVVRRVLGIMQ